MRVERLATLALVLVIASAGSAEAEPGGTGSRELLAQAAPSGNAAPPAAQPAPEAAPAAKPAPEAAPAAKPAPQAAPKPPPRRAKAPAPKRDPQVDTQQCTWVGKRTIRVLMRDDLIAADGFLRFYKTFGCPVRHLGEAFGCSLIGTSGAPAKDVEERVDACWKDPSAKPAATAAAPPPAPAGKPAAPPAKPVPKAVAPAPKPAAPPAKPEPETAYPKR